MSDRKQDPFEMRLGFMATQVDVDRLYAELQKPQKDWDKAPILFIIAGLHRRLAVAENLGKASEESREEYRQLEPLSLWNEDMPKSD